MTTAERMVLSCVLHYGAQAALALDRLTAEDFSSELYRRVFVAADKLYRAGRSIDLATVGAILGEQSWTDQYSSITSELSVPENLEMWVDKVISESQRRDVEILGQWIVSSLKDGRPAAEVKDEAERRMGEIGGRTAEAKIWTNGRLSRSVELMEDEEMGRRAGIASGFAALDHFTGGFHAAELTIIGARTSVGKSALALQVAVSMALAEIPVGYITTEMTAEALIRRALIMEARVDTYRRGWYEDGGHRAIVDAASRMYDIPLIGCDVPGLDLLRMSSIIRQMVRRDGCRIVFVDYLTMIQVRGERPRYEAVGMVTERLSHLAKELDIPICAMAQLSRRAEERVRPSLADLRESGNIEQDADVVILLHRPRDKDGLLQSDAELVVAKNRTGKTGVARLRFIAEHTRFEERTTTEV